MISLYFHTIFDTILVLLLFIIKNMNSILKKLTDAGVPASVVEKLQSGLGDKMESELMSGGLKAAAAKVGIDTKDLPEIDFKNIMEAAQEFMGKDVDGDGKTGISEAVENLKEAAGNTDMSGVKDYAQKSGTGFMAKIKSLFSSHKA